MGYVGLGGGEFEGQDGVGGARRVEGAKLVTGGEEAGGIEEAEERSSRTKRGR